MASDLYRSLDGYINLQKFAQFLMGRAKDPTLDNDNRKEAEFVLKDLRVMSQKARNGFIPAPMGAETDVQVVTRLLDGYSYLQKFSQFLVDRTKNPTVDDRYRQEAELVLRDIHVLAVKANADYSLAAGDGHQNRRSGDIKQ